MPDKHPSPWGSKLWDHVDLIRSMRLGRHSWKMIARHLGESHGVQISPQAVQNFFSRNSRRKRMPLGFEVYFPAPTAAQPPETVKKHEARPSETADDFSVESAPKKKWGIYDPNQETT
jgi:hypothetical protein